MIIYENHKTVLKKNTYDGVNVPKNKTKQGVFLPVEYFSFLYNNVSSLLKYGLDIWKVAEIYTIQKIGKTPYKVSSYRRLSLLQSHQKVSTRLVNRFFRQNYSPVHTSLKNHQRTVRVMNVY